MRAPDTHAVKQLAKPEVVRTQNSKPHNPTADIAVGSVFGNLTVKSKEAYRGNHAMYACMCNCGNISTYYGNNLKKGNSKGCRACSNELRKHLKKGEGGEVTHGMSKHPMYNAYRTMIARCTKQSHIQYHDYGGRGITVCDRWLESFENFFEDMRERPEGMSLDRVDNEKGYSKDNCRWADGRTQARNKSNTLYLEYKGEKLPLATFAERQGMNYNKLAKRIKLGWSIEKALETP